MQRGGLFAWLRVLVLDDNAKSMTRGQAEVMCQV
jgi:hypothetical protein